MTGGCWLISDEYAFMAELGDISTYLEYHQSAKKYRDMTFGPYRPAEVHGNNKKPTYD